MYKANISSTFCYEINIYKLIYCLIDYTVFFFNILSQFIKSILSILNKTFHFYHKSLLTKTRNSKQSNRNTMSKHLFFIQKIIPRGVFKKKRKLKQIKCKNSVFFRHLLNPPHSHHFQTKLFSAYISNKGSIKRGGETYLSSIVTQI